MFSYILLLASVCSANELLAAAMVKHLNLHQLITIQSNPNITLIKIMSANFISSQIYDPFLFQNISNVLSRQTMIKVTDTSLITQINNFPKKFQWIAEIDAKNLPFVPINCDVWITAEKNRIHQLHTVYQMDKDSFKYVEYYGSYSDDRGLTAQNQQPSTQRRNFHAIPLVISVPIPNVCDYKTGCWHYKLWLDFGRALNFTVVYVNTKELIGKYKGKYDGQAVVAAFHAISYVTTRPQFANDIMLAPILKGWVSMYVKDTYGTHGDNWLSYIRPFHTNVWICLAGWLALISIIIMILHYYFGYELSFILETGLTPFDAICCQGATVSTKKQKSRITSFLPQLVASVVYPAYGAAIVSFLTVHIQTFPFEDLEGMIKDGTYRIGYLKVDLFCAGLVKGDKRLAQFQIPDDELSSSYSENMARLCNDRNYVFLGYNNLFEENSNKSCQYLQIPSPVTFLFTGIPIPKNSSYLTALQWLLIKMHSSGLISRIQKEVTPSIAAQQQNFDPIPLRQLVVPFLILVIGFFLGPLILICECCLSTMPKNPMRRKRLVVFNY